MLSPFWVTVRWEEWGTGQITYGYTLGRPLAEPSSLLSMIAGINSNLLEGI